MWPFKNKKNIEEESPIISAINELKKFRDVGETFNYLGRNCLVTRHSGWNPYIGVIPELHCDYADDNGVIHSLSFGFNELDSLIQQNEPNMDKLKEMNETNSNDLLGVKKERFNDGIDNELLANGFAYYDDWKYGPQTSWSVDYEHYTIKLMKHNFGYSIIIDAHSSGDRSAMNVGSSNNAQDIIAVKDALERLF